MAILRYITQGLEIEKNHLIEVKNVIGSESHTSIIICSAFLREEAVLLLENELKKNKDKIMAMVGISNGVTSVQGLSKLYESGVEIYTVDTGIIEAIYHVKNYVGFNDKEAVVITGSANFTPGGLFRNIESSTIAKLDLGDISDKSYLERVLEDIKILLNEYSDNVKKIPNKEYIKMLFRQGRLVDEVSERKSNNRKLKSNKNSRNRIKRMELKVKKFNIKRSKKEQNEKIIKRVVKNYLIGYEEVWNKVMTNTDAQHPENINTKPTGHLKLSQDGYMKNGQLINHYEYFRNDIFANLNWQISEESKMVSRKVKSLETGLVERVTQLESNTKEVAKVLMEIIIENNSYGYYELSISHDLERGAKQRNVPTWIHWREANKLLRNKNFSGKKISLLKNIDNKFKIKID